MKIIVSQQGKKLLIEFNYHPKPLLDKEGKKGRLVVDKYIIDKSDGFLLTVDRFLKKNNISRIVQIRHIEFINTVLLTERVIRAIIRGLRF